MDLKAMPLVMNEQQNFFLNTFAKITSEIYNVGSQKISEK